MRKIVYVEFKLGYLTGLIGRIDWVLCDDGRIYLLSLDPTTRKAIWVRGELPDIPQDEGKGEDRPLSNREQVIKALAELREQSDCAPCVDTVIQELESKS